jgi:hypothetical protein
MLIGFIIVAMDAIHNTAAKWRYMTAGQSNVPITITTLGGAVSGIGAQHCDALEIWLGSSPGLKVLQPSNPLEAYALLTASIFDDDPVVFIEQSALTGRSLRVPTPEPGTRFELGKANVTRTGADVSVIGYGAHRSPWSYLHHRWRCRGLRVRVDIGRHSQHDDDERGVAAHPCHHRRRVFAGVRCWICMLQSVSLACIHLLITVATSADLWMVRQGWFPYGLADHAGVRPKLLRGDWNWVSHA